MSRESTPLPKRGTYPHPPSHHERIEEQLARGQAEQARRKAAAKESDDARAAETEPAGADETADPPTEQSDAG